MTQQAVQTQSDSKKETQELVLADLGITAGTTTVLQLLQAAHTNRPTWKTADENRPTVQFGSRLLLQTQVRLLLLKLYSTASAVSQQLLVHFMLHTLSDLSILDPQANGGTGLAAGHLYAQYNVTEESMGADRFSGVDSTPNVADFQFFRYEGGATTITSMTTSNFHKFRQTFKYKNQ